MKLETFSYDISSAENIDEYKSQTTSIKMHKCTEEDIKTYFEEVDEYWLPFLCDSVCPTDPSQIRLYGDYTSVVASFAKLVVNECKD